MPALIARQADGPVAEVPDIVHGQGEIILVVEDDPTVRETLVATVSLLNYRVLEAANGREALDTLEEGRAETISLVLSDLVMPEIGGRGLIQKMRERGLKIPVVMLTGHSMESKLKDLEEQGLVRWMLKPPSLEHLSQLLARAIREGAD